MLVVVGFYEGGLWIMFALGCAYARGREISVLTENKKLEGMRYEVDGEEQKIEGG